MTRALRIGVIGLGVMGQRMLQRIAEHSRLVAAVAWDPNPQAVATTRRLSPDIAIAQDAAAVASAPGLDALYIASPPVTHMEHATRGFDAGRAVFCEKPLSVDFPSARAMIDRIARENRKSAVNFSMAAWGNVAALQRALVDGSIGTPQHVEIAVAFDIWPSAWQSAAGRWLAERVEGGFTREVLSHYVYVLQRLLGPARVEASMPIYPDDGRTAETRLDARLVAGGLPVTIAGHVGARVEESTRLTLVGSAGKAEIFDWAGLRRCGADQVWVSEGNLALNRRVGQAAQLDAFVDLIEGRQTVLPDFAEALTVQETIEAMLDFNA